MTDLIAELQFWLSFLILNYLNYFVIYLLHRQESSFLPYIDRLKEKKIGLTADTNLDFFRYSVELSIFIICSRFLDLGDYSTAFSVCYFFILVFNIYQFSFRKIYETEPILFNDFKLFKNGLAIVWHESKWKMIAAGLVAIVVFLVFNLVLDIFLFKNFTLGVSLSFMVLSGFKLFVIGYAIYGHKGFYLKYPNDIYLRYHFIIAELAMNLKKSLDCYKLSKLRFGDNYMKARKDINFELIDNPPNIHFIFIESYGAFVYQSEKLKKEAYQTLRDFQEKIKLQGYHTLSNFSESTTAGGQSWLTYTSVLFGFRIDNNTLFENLLNDSQFRESNGIMQLFKKIGYTNYNLNPINPINGITVPYDAMRKLYCIDRWILNEDIKYTGDKYGFGAAAPDQFSMNYTMDLIKKEKNQPYTFFYLTQSSHSPFPKIKLVEDWKTLNQGDGRIHSHQGFLKYPTIEDYDQAIKYQIENLQKFISENENKDDLFVIMGDHQPPILSSPDEYGFETPVHIVSRNTGFLESFKEYGFELNLEDCKTPTKHEAMFSVFLRSFIKSYGKPNAPLPDYEPDGVLLK